MVALFVKLTNRDNDTTRETPRATVVIVAIDVGVDAVGVAGVDSALACKVIGDDGVDSSLCMLFLVPYRFHACPKANDLYVMPDYNTAKNQPSFASD